LDVASLCPHPICDPAFVSISWESSGVARLRISALRSKKRWRGGRSECCASASKVAARRHPGPGRTQEPVQKTINNMEQRVPPEHWRDGPTARPQADPARSWLRSSPPPQRAAATVHLHPYRHVGPDPSVLARNETGTTLPSSSPGVLLPALASRPSAP